MIQLSLSRTVGKGAYGSSAAGVKTIQCCMAAIKGRTRMGMKPLYDGKIDGKCGPKTIEAICAFQAMEGLPVTGKLEPHGLGIAKLKARTPGSAQADMTRELMSEKLTGNTGTKMVAKRITDETLSELLS